MPQASRSSDITQANSAEVKPTDIIRASLNAPVESLLPPSVLFK